MSALVISWNGAFVLCFGIAAWRSAMFALLLLFGMIPPPEIVLSAAVRCLQLGSAWAADLLFACVGVPVGHNGITLEIPGLVLAVGPECSSIRSSSMLFIVTMVAGQVLLRSPWRRALMLGFALLLSVAKNGLRIFTIAMLGTRVDARYLTGSLHREGGILFFAIALAGVFALVWILRRRELRLPGTGLIAARAGDIYAATLTGK
jgi:exosortase